MISILNTTAKISLMLTGLLLVSTVYADYISISTTMEDCTIIDDSCQVAVSTENRGDEAAYDVGLIFSLPEGFDAKNVPVGRLEIDTPVQKTININKTKAKLPGTYPGVLFVEYKDANNYPFSAIVPFDIVQNQRTASPITGLMEEIQLRGTKSKKLQLRMKNSADEAYEITVDLFLPRELDARGIKKELNISPLGEKRVEFEVNSFSALPGSTYPIFGSITHESEGKFYSTFIRGVVRIEEERSVFSEEYMLVILAVLLVIFMFYQVGDWKWKK